MQHGFGKAAEYLRKRQGLTFRAFSQLLEEQTGVIIDSGGLSRIESGQREPRLAEAIAIATTLGVELSQMTGLTVDLERDLEKYQANLMSLEVAKMDTRRARSRLKGTLDVVLEQASEAALTDKDRELIAEAERLIGWQGDEPAS